MTAAILIDLLVEIARPLILQRYRGDSCIASTRIGLDVCAHFGVEAAVQPVSLFVSNKKLWKRIKKSGANQNLLPLRDGEWSVGVGFGFDPRRLDEANAFNGHLIIVVPGPDDKEVLIDLSLDQCSRPQHQINLGPAARLVPSRWRTEQFGIIVGDAVCVYYPIVNAHYLQSPDWLPVSDTAALRREVVAEIIRQIEARLAELAGAGSN